MNDGALQVALRKLRMDMSQRKTWAVLAALSLIVGVSGPFQTYEYLSDGPRIFYWSVVVVATYSIGSLISDAMSFALAWLHVALRLALIILVMSIVITGFILCSNTIAFGVWPNGFAAFQLHFWRIAPICAAIVVAAHFLEPKEESEAVPDILSRLPIEKRGTLVALSVSDHYVNVMTDKGQSLILMRLSDAIKETNPTDGLQVHRSNWIAKGQVARVERIGDRAMCHMTTGAQIPVSRSYISALREADLLPRVGHG